MFHSDGASDEARGARHRGARPMRVGNNGRDAGGGGRAAGWVCEHRRAAGGSGVGLSLARAIVEAHNGSLRAHREQNTIIFELSLPLA